MGLGWWADGPRPGDDGAAVVVGHVDLDGRPGVFGRLAGAAPGSVVAVTRGERVVRYRVTRVDRYTKAGFPTDVVYRPSARAELRLVTCGGRFDPRTGHYEDNVVVTAVRA
jgi:sortase (surface protein transpeptidase)